MPLYAFNCKILFHPNQVSQTSPSERAKLLWSKYRPGNYYAIEENVMLSFIPENIHKHYSTDTEIYWPLEDHCNAVNLIM